MPRQNKLNRSLSSITIAALLLSGSAVAGWGNYAAAEAAAPSFFSDVAKEHWAAKHIAKLNLQGIITGYNGEFKPNDSVTQQEAIVMAIRFMGKSNEIKNQDYVFPESFKIGAYFRPYVGEAMRLNLIDRDTEFKLAEGIKDGEWGSQKASREWVTKLIVKAIGEQKKAEELSGTTPAFSDSKAIGSSFTGYINAAVSLQLIKGVTADKFDPKGSITRASIATILSRAEAIFPVAYAGQSNAILTGATDSSISLYGNKEIKTYTIKPSTLVYTADSEKPVALADLAAHTDVTIIADSEGNVLYVEQLSSTQKVEKLSGTVVRVIPSSNVIWLAKDNDPNPVTLNYDDTLIVKDGTGATIPVTSLEVDSKVEILRDSYREQPKLVSIAVKSAPINKSGQGVVKAINSATTSAPGSMTIINAQGTEETYPVASSVDVILQGRIADLSQLRSGDSVTFEVKDSIITKVTVQQTTATVVRAQFHFASQESKSIQFMLSGKQDLDARFVTDTVMVQIEGQIGATLSDLVKGDELELSLNDKNQVTNIKVLNRKVEVANAAVIVSYDADLKALTLHDPATKQLLSVFLTDQTRITNFGTAISVKDIAPLLTKNRKVSVGRAGDKAIFLEIVYKYTGTVTAINGAAGQLTLALTNGSSFTIGMLNPGVEIKGRSNATLSDIKIGDTVSTLLNGEQDKVLMLQLHTTEQVEIVSVDKSANKLKIKNAYNNISDMTLAGWELFNEKDEKITSNNLAAGQIIGLTYAGSSPQALKIVTLKPGRITSLTADKAEVATYSGETVEVALNGNTLVKNGAATLPASSLKVGDRVEVSKASNQVQVNVNYGVERKFWKYDAVTGEVYFKRTSINDEDYKFKLASNARVTQGDSAITVNQLKDGDNVQVYIYRGVLQEIVKSS